MRRLPVLGLGLLMAAASLAADLPTTLKAVKPSVVGVGTFIALRQQQDQLSGTGFVLVDGRHVLTNAPVGPQELDEDRRETIAVYVPAGGDHAERRPARIIKRDSTHDLCLLRALRLGRSADVQEGALYAVIGFPILTALGLRPVTHRGIVSAISPIILPLTSGKDLTPENPHKLARPFGVFQLDATAYPGNSGCPLYGFETGRVVGVINSVFVKESKEMALSSPSGISYALSWISRGVCSTKPA